MKNVWLSSKIFACCEREIIINATNLKFTNSRAVNNFQKDQRLVKRDKKFTFNASQQKKLRN